MVQLVKKFIADESGATAIEYGLIIALIALAIITSMSLIGNNITDTFGAASTSLESSH